MTARVLKGLRSLTCWLPCKVAGVPIMSKRELLSVWKVFDMLQQVAWTLLAPCVALSSGPVTSGWSLCMELPPRHFTARHKSLMKCACFLQMWPLELQVRRLNPASTVNRIFRSGVCCSPLAPSSAAIILCTQALTRRSLRESRCAGARRIVYFFPQD